MQKNQRMNLPAWEWLTLIGVILGAGVSVTVFAMTHFETKEDSREKRDRLEKRLDRQEDLLIATMRGLQIPVPPPKVQE